MSDKNTSTLQSYIDSATATVQGAIGNLTGNPADQVSQIPLLSDALRAPPSPLFTFLPNAHYPVCILPLILLTPLTI